MILNRVSVERRTFVGALCGVVCSHLMAGCKSTAPPDELPAPSQPYINVVVRPLVAPVRQLSEKTCWAAVWTMMLSWREGHRLTIEEAVARLGRPWVVRLERGDGMEAQTFTEEGFLQDSALQAKPPANYFLSAYVELLASHGPLWINTGDGILNHAMLLVGAQTRRDGSTEFRFVDPKVGWFITKSGAAFFADFEREARAIVDRHLKWDFRYQIFYWPSGA